MPRLIAATTPATTPGTPCRLCTPHVSLMPMRASKKGLRYIKPKVEMEPVISPVASAAPGLMRTGVEPDAIAHADPIATPPARVAFYTSTMLMRVCNNAAVMNVDKVPPIRDRTVLIPAKCRRLVPSGVSAIAELKLGQYTHKKRVPIMAARSWR